MIEDLLLAAKAESGTLALVSEPFILRELILECTNLLAPEAQKKDLQLTINLDPTLPRHVTGDAHRLQQILLNLIRNAIKFTSTGSIAVHAKARSIDASFCRVHFSVTDTGIGISEHLLEHLFERFSQADSRANRQYGGVGLGLSICKQLVDLMGGRIWVESKPDRGSTFSFTVPLGMLKLEHETDPRLQTVPESSDLQPTTANTLPRELKILLAEDSLESQNVMRLYLSKTPYQLDCVDSGAGVVETFKSGRYDLVLMDLHMPDIDGCEATRCIRAWEREQDLPRTPIVALTADGFAESKDKSLAAGCDDFLTKPIKMGTVLSTIQRYMTESSHTGSLDAELSRLRPKFIQNRHHDVLALRTAIDANDFEEIKTIGHRIKGLAGSFGLHAIGAIGGMIEQAAMDRRLDRVTTSLTELIQAIKEAEDTSIHHDGQASSP
jgi:CheY-like chemotaxis protein